MIRTTLTELAVKGLLLIGISISVWMMLFSFALAESVQQFDVQIEVAENGTLQVTEDITYDFGKQARHGIFREILTTHAQPAATWYKDRVIELEPIAVKKDGQPEPYENLAGSSGSSGFNLQIGDADKTITGTHRYEITYQVRGAISQTDELTELYWNATGNQWDVPIEHTSVTLQLAGESELGSQAACYAGAADTSKSCQEIVYPEDESGKQVTFVQSQRLAPGAGLTIAQELELAQPIEVIEHQRYLFPVLGIGLLWLLGLGRYLYRGKTHFRKSTTVIAQYEPYEDFAPLFTGVLFDKRLDPRDITAGIISLAEQGFISITQKTEKTFFVFETQDYEITLEKAPSAAESIYAKDLLSLLFADMGTESMTAGQKIRLSEIKKNQSKLRKNAKVVKNLQSAVKDRLVNLEFVEKGWSKKVRALAVLYIVVALLSMVFTGGAVMSWLPLPIVILLVAFIPVTLIGLLIVTNDRRTSKGYEAMYYLRGFKDFLSVTDKERYKFHNAPSKSPQQFMQYLPYAIAFGVEKEWAEVFSDITIVEPDWYQSEVPGSRFSAAAFTSDLSSFSNSLTSSAGASGSSGGGSVGGGSGGGGGGSW